MIVWDRPYHSMTKPMETNGTPYFCEAQGCRAPGAPEQRSRQEHWHKWRAEPSRRFGATVTGQMM